MSAEKKFKQGLAEDRPELLERAIDAEFDPMTKGPGGDWLRGKDDYTALHVASRGSPRLMRMLLDAGMPPDVVDDQGRTPLAYVWKTAVFEMLLQAGADPHHKDQWGCNALFYLGMSEDAHHNVASLLALGVDPTPLHEHGSRSWFEYLYDGEVDGLRAFVDAGVDLNPPEEYGAVTALHRVAERGEVECARLLIGAGVDLLAKNEQGQTAADIARSENHTEILKLIQDAGGDPRADDAKLPDDMLDPNNAPILALIGDAKIGAVSDETKVALAELDAKGDIGAVLLAAMESGDDADLEPFWSAMEAWFDDAHSEVAEGFKQYASATLRMGTIGERDDAGEYGGPFELWGVAKALTCGASFADLTGLTLFGDRPFPGFMIGKRDDVEIWILAGHLYYGKRNGFVIVQPREHLIREARSCAKEADFHSLVRDAGDYNAMPDFMELLYTMLAPLDVGHVFFAQRYAADRSSEMLIQAIFGWDDARIKTARRRAGGLDAFEEALR